MAGRASAVLAIRIISEVKDAQKGLAETTKSVGKWQKAVHAGAKIAIAGFALAGGAALKLAQGAAEDEAAQARLANTLKNTTGATSAQIAAVEDWITAQGKAYGITDDQLRPALGRLATATGDVASAQELASLSMDVAAGTGKSFEQVSTAMARAANGNIGALGRLGIATKNADGSTKSFAQVTDELGKKFSGAAATQAGTLEGKITILKTALSEAGETIGYMLIPILTKLANWLQTQVIPRIEALTNWASSNTGTVKVMAGIIAGLGAALIILSGALKLVAVAQKIQTAIQWAQNSAFLASPVTWIVLGILALVAAVVLIATRTKWFQKIWQAVWKGIRAIAQTVISWLRNAWRTLVSVLVSVARRFQAAWRSVVNAIRSLVSGVASFFRSAWSGAVSAVRAYINTWRSAFSTAVNVVKGLIRAVVAVFKGDWRGAANAVRGIVNSFASFFRGIFNSLPAPVRNVASAIRDTLGAAFSRIRGAVSGLGSTLSAPFTTVRRAIQPAIDLINKLIAALRRVKMPKLPGLGRVASLFSAPLGPGFTFPSISAAGYRSPSLSRATPASRAGTADFDGSGNGDTIIELHIGDQYLGRFVARAADAALDAQNRRIRLRAAV